MRAFGTRSFWTWKKVAYGVLIITVFLGLPCLDYLRWPTCLIRMRLLYVTPKGSLIETVRANADQRGFRDTSHQQNFGHSEIGPGGSYTRGSKTVRGHLGNYTTLFRCDVVCVWIFDDEDKLIDVVVWKEYDVI
jgi:hypothetical protein